MSLPRYAEYRDSGVEWLGRIPSHWATDRLKRRCHVFPSNVDKKSADSETAVRLCNYTDVYYNDRIRSDMTLMDATASEDQIAKFTLRAGDTVFTKDSETANDIGVAAFVPSDLPGIVCGYHLSIARPLDGANGAYVKRLFDAHYTKARFAVLANGLTRVGLNQYAVDNVELPWPPLEEQTVIAAFLDRETAKIDALIAEQEKLLALLAEKRQSTISHAVTRGLDPNAPMKDSGIPWLGEVPAHWEVKPLKRIARLITGMTPPTNDEENYGEDGHPWIRPEDLDERGFPSTPSRFLSAKGWGGARHVAPNSSLICCIGSIGKVGFVDSCVSTNQQITAAEFSGNGRFFYYVTCAARRELELSATGNVLRILNSERLGILFYPAPTLGEQKEIAEFLDDKTAKFDDLASEGVCAIGLLKERRAALIAAAVTGQIDVHGAVESEAA